MNPESSFRWGLSAAIAVALGACFNPTYNNPLCGPAGECPGDLMCVQGVCVSGSEIDAPAGADATDAPADAPTDAPTDAATDAPIDGPSIDGPNIDAPTPVCGDGTRTPPEVCDDGNTVTETQCPYGMPSCTACNASCTMQLNLTGPFCGDGIVQSAFEVCDDRNNLACGTCNATCTMVIAAAAATGRITCTTSGEIFDGETFVLDDGFSAPRAFEFEKNGGVQAGNIPVMIQGGGGAGTVADAIALAINGSGLLIQASRMGGPTVELVHIRTSALGNRMILENVSSPNFSVIGMSGGSAGDCPSGTGCVGNADCASLTCTAANVCQ